jgi:hypothetical protein
MSFLILATSSDWYLASNYTLNCFFFLSSNFFRYASLVIANHIIFFFYFSFFSDLLTSMFGTKSVNFPYSLFSVFLLLLTSSSRFPSLLRLEIHQSLSLESNVCLISLSDLSVFWFSINNKTAQNNNCSCKFHKIII